MLEFAFVFGGPMVRTCAPLCQPQCYQFFHPTWSAPDVETGTLAPGQQDFVSAAVTSSSQR